MDNSIKPSDLMLGDQGFEFILLVYVYVTAILRNQIFIGIPNPFRESGESL